jgi:hypothetical protein
LLLNRQATIVLYALSWLVTFFLLVLWSLAAWAFQSIAAWTVSNAGALAAGSGAIEGLRAPDWLAPWIPAEFAVALSSTLSALSPAIEAAVNQAPALAGGLSAAVWVVWGVGSALIVILGLVSGRLITLLRRRGSLFAAPSMGPAASN